MQRQIWYDVDLVGQAPMRSQSSVETSKKKLESMSWIFLLDSNLAPLVSEATALPTESQPLLVRIFHTQLLSMLGNLKGHI